MPSDVQMQQSAHMQRAQSQLIVHPSECALASDNDKSVYEQRYHALRNAGFEHETATKYSAKYSSVNEVIDTILSQSLQQLSVDSNHGGSDGKSAKTILSSGHHQSASLDQNSSATNSQSTHVDNLCPSKAEALSSANDNIGGTHHTLPLNLTETISPLTCHNVNGGIHHGAMAGTDHIRNNDCVDESNKARVGTNCFNGIAFEANRINDSNDTAASTDKSTLLGVDYEKAPSLSELAGFSHLFSGHDMNEQSQLKSICDLVESKLLPLDQSNLFSNGYSKMNHYFEEDCASGVFNQNLLVTVLKDGLLDADEAILEDEGVGADPNVASTSPPASTSSLSSSGASSLLLDSSSSPPSSFSSLSSSISNTPPDALSGFEPCALEPTIMSDPLFGFQYSAKLLDSVPMRDLFAAGLQPKFPKLAGNDDSKLDCIDLTQEHVSHNTSNGFDSQPGDLTQSFCSNEVANDQPVHHSSARKKSPSTHDNFAYATLPPKYSSESIFAQPYINEDTELLFEGNFAGHQLAGNNFGEGFGKFSKQPQLDASIRDNVTMFGKTLFGEDSTADYLAFMNGSSMRQHQQQQQSLFDYEQSSRMNDSFGFGLDKMNKGGSDHFGEYAFRPDAYFGLAPSDSDLLCGNLNSQSSYSASLLNQRTFADIAASNVISGGAKAAGSEHCLGAIGDCKSPKSNSMSCSNLNLGNLNTGYFNLFASGNNATQNAAFYDHQNQALKKSFCPQSNNFQASLSPISGKVYGNGSMINEQINFAHQQQQSMRANHLSMGSMLSSGLASNLANGHSASEMVTSNCDGSLLNKPTNLMGYKGLWVCNISPDVTLAYLKRRFRRFGHFTGIQTFERRATNGSNIVFVHYDNHFSPVEAISCLHNYTGQDLCADPIEPLKLRFAPSMEQSRAGQLPTLEQARKMVERHGECFNWRLSSGCHRGIRCQLKHVPINKEIDSQPWVKALKKKNADM